MKISLEFGKVTKPCKYLTRVIFCGVIRSELILQQLNNTKEANILEQEDDIDYTPHRDVEHYKKWETFKGIPLDEIQSFRVYIGRNVPDAFGNFDYEITEEQMDFFFENQNIFEGYNRVPSKGMWLKTPGKSEVVSLFEVSLREVLELFLDYIDKFNQDAVYIECLNGNPFLFETIKPTEATNYDTTN